MPTDRYRELLVPALLAVAAVTAPSSAQTPPAAASPIAPLNAAERKAVIDGAIAKLDAHYIYPDKVAIIAKTLRHKASSGGYDAMGNPKAFADAVNADIATVAHDRHLRLSWSAEPLPPLEAGGEPSAAEIEQMKAMIARDNYLIPRIEVLDGNIGYLKINGFVRADLAGPTYSSAMAFLQHSDALIVDLRDNHGGDPGMVAFAVSYLVPPETEINDFHQRNTVRDVQSWSFPYVPGGRWSTDKPVYVLTSKRTASGAEEFAYDIQQLKRGTIVGESTWGGANPGGDLPIDSHFAIFVPDGAAVNPISKTNWEGTGVKPDVAVDPAVALETARHLALEKMIEHATGDRRADLQKLLAPQSDAGSAAK